MRHKRVACKRADDVGCRRDRTSSDDCLHASKWPEARNAALQQLLLLSARYPTITIAPRGARMATGCVNIMCVGADQVARSQTVRARISAQFDIAPDRGARGRHAKHPSVMHGELQAIYTIWGCPRLERPRSWRQRSRLDKGCARAGLRLRSVFDAPDPAALAADAGRTGDGVVGPGVAQRRVDIDVERAAIRRCVVWLTPETGPTKSADCAIASGFTTLR